MSPKLRLGDIIIGPTLSVTSVMLISVHHVVAVSYVDKHIYLLPIFCCPSDWCSQVTWWLQNVLIKKTTKTIKYKIIIVIRVTFELVVSEEKTFNQDPRIVHGGHVFCWIKKKRENICRERHKHHCCKVWF